MASRGRLTGHSEANVAQNRKGRRNAQPWLGEAALLCPGGQRPGEQTRDSAARSSCPCTVTDLSEPRFPHP